MQNNKGIKFLNKSELYKKVSQKAVSLGFDLYSPNYRIDSVRLAMDVCLNLSIEFIDFKETKICGILFKGKNTTTIGLNSRRSAHGKNFDCMHELIHYWFHDGDYFCCAENSQNHLEWQANEGAAQFLLPYQNFIPNYSYYHDHFYANYSPMAAHDALIKHLAARYLVGEMVVQYRLASLNSEIIQFVDGVKIDDIKITSRKFT